MPHSQAARNVPTPADSLREYGRGLAGGLLFSLPLLYTMEVWWEGFIAHPDRVLGYLACVFLLLLGYNRYAGIRRDASWVEVVIDSVEEFGLGVLTAAGVLFLLGRIGPGQSFDEVVGKILIEAGIVAIGFSVGTAQLGSDDGEDEGFTGDDGKPASFWNELTIATCGAVLFAANIGPTEEIVVIAVETAAVRLLGLAVVSILVAMLILYYSDFVQAKPAQPHSWVQIAAGTVVTYGIALIVSAGILWFFGRFDGAAPGIRIRQMIVLGFPSVLGASAGRLLIQQR
ncbi:MAG TPA: TIGR02587 family membrane protein [Thermoanaerobaculia bacterium]|nr:TIGR02587 family membrane protein [Thermoanaerobaculia bacterium]